MLGGFSQMKTAKVQTGLRLEEKLYMKLIIIADEEGRSLNNMTEYIIRQFVNQYESEHGNIPTLLDAQPSDQD